MPTVMAMTVSWACVESRHNVVRLSCSNKVLAFKREWMEAADACHAAAWKGNKHRTRRTIRRLVD